MSVTISRNQYASCLTVYRDEHYCGLVFCPCPGGETDYLTSPWTSEIAQRHFTTEADAINYLLREGIDTSVSD